MTSVFLRQRFGRLAVLSVGKINMIDVYASGREFSGGRGIETFQRIAFVAPVSGIVPPAIFGAIGTVILPPAAITLMVYDPKNALNRTGFEDLFDDGVTLYGTFQLGTRWFQQSGKHLFNAAWSSQDKIDLRDLPYLLLPPGAADVLSTTNNRWYVSYAFEQTLWRIEKDSKRAVGLFGQVALSDGNPNPARWSALGSLSGTSPIPGRDGDRLGVAAFSLGVSNNLKDGLRLDRLGDEYGEEVFYNLAVTPWFRVSGDLQVISPALGDSPVVLLGLRAQLRL